MKQYLRTLIIAFAMAAFTLLSTIIILPVSAGAAESDKQPIIIDMSSRETVDIWLDIVASGNNNDWVGRYAFDENENALSLTYASGSNGELFGRYKFCIKFDARKFTSDYAYTIVTYKTSTKENVPLLIAYPAARDASVDLCSDVSVSNGNYVMTPPTRLLDNIITRMSATTGANHVEIASPITATDSDFFLKEIAFFVSEEQANQYILEKTPVEDASTDIILTAKAPAEVAPGETFVADIVASTTKADAKGLTGINFTLEYNDVLTLNSIVPAGGIGGEGISNVNSYGWYFDSITPIMITKDASAVIAKASFTVPEAFDSEYTVEIGFVDTEDALNAALWGDDIQLGFKPDTVKGSTVVKMPTYKFTVPTGFIASVNKGAPASAGTTVDVRAGDEIILTALDDIMVKSVTYKIGNGTETAINAANGTYTIRTDDLNGDITVNVATYDYSFIGADEYMALAADQMILVLPVTTAGVNDTTYTIDGKPAYYSSRYDAYVAIVNVETTPAEIGAVLDVTAAPATEIEYNGDINRDGKITAGDAALISSILHSYTVDSKASDRSAVTDIMRLEADVCGKYVIGGSYVSVVDSTWVLYTSVGLTFEAPSEPEVFNRQLLSSVKPVAFDKMLKAASKNNPVSFKQNVNDMLEGTTVTKIGVPVISISDPTKDCMTNIYLTDTSYPVTIIETYPLVIPANTYTSQNVNEWVYFDLDIDVGKDRALAFGAKDETISWGYTDSTVTSPLKETRGCQIGVDNASPKQFDVSLLFDIHFEEVEDTDKSMLEGKYISIIGASTSTYTGFSNSTLYNSTIADNSNYYTSSKLATVNDTWWMRTINELNLKLCVNNSWSGSCVTTKVDAANKAGCMDRTAQLHNDKFNQEPDIIVLITGGNDALRGYEIGSYNGVEDIYNASTKEYIGDCTKFGQAYATMVHKVQARYPDADIYVCSMLNWRGDAMVPYNTVIEQIASEFSVTYVDFYNGTDISPDTKGTYLASDGVHPNAEGFKEMSDCLVNILTEKYN